MPPATLAAFAHHGDPYDCLTATAQAAHAALDELAAAGKVEAFGRARARRWLARPLPGFTTTL
jgi:hypothetical protein